MAASVTAISPTSAKVGTPTDFVITGANFSNQLKVSFAAKSCSNHKLVSASKYTLRCEHDKAEKLDMVVNDGSKDIYTQAITFSASTAPTPTPVAASVTNISPTSAKVGTPTDFVITGANFSNQLKVSFAAKSCSNHKLVSASKYTLRCEHDKAEKLDMVVNDGSKDIYTQAITFSASTAPTPTPIVASVTAISPTSAKVGTPTDFVITGANFSNQLKVSFAAKSCSNHKLVSVSKYTLRCEHDKAEKLDMVVNDGSKDIYTQAITFSASTAPTPTPVAASVTAISPTSAKVGTPTDFVITGANFSNQLKVSFAAKSCSNHKLVSASKYTLRCEHDKAEKLDMVVNDGSKDIYTQAITFSASTAPTPTPVAASVTAISPTSAEVGTPTDFVITGANFSNQLKVSFAAKNCSNHKLVSASKYTLRCEHDKAEKLDMVVKDGSKDIYTQPITFSAAPKMTKVSPSTVYINTPTEFVITGKNFTSQMNVTLDGATCKQGTFVSATEYKITCQHDTAEQLVMKIKEDPVHWWGIQFTAAPTVTAVSPTAAYINTPTEFVITGQNLHSGASNISVTLGNAACQTTSAADTEYKVSCQHDTAESVDMVVNDGSKDIYTQAIQFSHAPVVTKITPVSVKIHTGQNHSSVFKIHGQHLTDKLTVTVGNANCQHIPLFDNSQLVSCKHYTAETLDMVVKDGATVLKTQAVTFVAETAAATVTSITPATAIITEPTAFEIKGTNFTDELEVYMSYMDHETVDCSGQLNSTTSYTATCKYNKPGVAKLYVREKDHHANVKEVKVQDITFLAAKVSSVEPTKTYTGKLTEFVIRGERFSDRLQVKMRDATCQPGQVVSATEYRISCQLDGRPKTLVMEIHDYNNPVKDQNIKFILPAPKNLQVQRISDDSVKVTWSAVPGANRYKVDYQPGLSNSTMKTDYVTAPEITLTGLQVGSRYWVYVSAGWRNNFGLGGLTAVKVGKVNDTGIITCATADSTSNNENCGHAVANATGSQVPLGQDGAIGTGKNGSKGMRFSHVTGFTGECVQDENTGLMWEVKQTTTGLHHKDNTYTWYNPSKSQNGGLAGIPNGGTCTGSDCDTDAFVKAVNVAGWCGFNDWRMPTVAELLSIVDYSKGNLAIDGSYFANTASEWYWSASPHASDNGSAWIVHFGDGYDNGGYKGNEYRVRLVRVR